MAVQRNSDKPKFPRLLICEGPEDRFFLQRLIDVRNLPKFHILPSGGNSKFSQTIRRFQVERPKTYRSLRNIVIVADNDEDPSGRFREVCDHIERVFGQGVGPTVPQQKTRTSPAVTVLMIPWTNEPGHLEKLCCDAARDAAKGVASHIDSLFAMLGSDSWNQSRLGKAWLRTNLAVRCVHDPFVRLGDAFDEPRNHGLIPVDHSSFDRIAEFLATFV